MVKHIKYLFAGAMMVSVAACDHDFVETNTNPNDPIEVPGGLLMADIERNAINTLYNIQIGGEMGESWIQHWSWVQYNDAERYSPRQTSIEALWDIYYEDVIADARSMELLAEKEKNAALQGAAITLQAFGYAVLTDVYGQVPFTEAMKASTGNFAPVYDEQETIYTGIHTMLDKASDLLATGTGEINESFDLMYHGDIAKWEKFANSLKFRTLMRVSGRMDVKAQLQALMSKPMFTSNDDEAKMTYLLVQPNANPIYETIVYGNRLETKVGEALVNTMTNLSDPRLPVYAQENDGGIYRGKPAGIEDVPSPLYNYNNVSALGTFYLQPSLPGYFLSNAELQFLKAEAAQNNLIGGDAATFYNAGIAASMAFNGVDGSAYVASAQVAYNPANGLQQIGTQKWLALYSQGIEAWTEWRRTKFPALTSAIEPIPSTNEIPSRFPYPATEQTTNRASYDAAIGRQGADALWTKVWWMN
jgi:hypothetical protein